MKKTILFKRIWILSKPFHKQLLVVIFLMSAQVGLMSVFPIAFGHLIDGITQKISQEVVLGIGLWIFVALLRTVIGYAREYFETNHLESQFTTYLQGISLKKFFGISIGEHNMGHSIIKQNVMRKGESAVGGFVRIFVYDVLPILVQVVVPMILILHYAPLIGAVVVVATAIFVVFSLKYNIKFIPSFRMLDTNENKTSKQRGEFVTHVQTVQVNAQEPRAQNESRNSFVTYSKDVMNIWTKYFNWFYGGQMFINFSQMVTLCMLAYMTFVGKLPISSFVAIYMWLGHVLGSLNSISNIQRNLAGVIAPIIKYFGFLDYVSNVSVPKNPVKLDKFKGTIVFENVSYTYNERGDSSESEVLEGGSENTLQRVAAIKNISMVLEAGKRYAFVGKSGSGKSTAVSLMLRAFDPQSGKITVDGVDLKDLDYRELREHVGVVPQEVILFDGTLRYNITFGLGENSFKVSSKDLEKVGEQSRIAEFAKTLENGWDTMIGERGIKLSGGQRQRIGIARALIKNPKVLIFDEATSNLDTENEAQIRDSIHEASEGKTTIIIAHRLATVKDVDTIIVFNDGEIVGSGSHSELISTNEYYKRLVQNQMIV
jgi:ABC-type multidrug transport system fused ATPase/permease subunit